MVDLTLDLKGNETRESGSLTPTEDLVGRGRTADGGVPHAEVAALAQAGPAARGATVYVTLFNGSRRVDNIVGVVHNCTLLGKAYRCGIQFRTWSELQMDQEATEIELVAMEAYFIKNRK